MRHSPNPQPPGSDEYYMYEALQLAQRGLGWTSPNPLVGSVLVRDGVIIGRGAHLHDGEQHAEALALRDAGDARGATCYATLEPCTHVGRQPACTTLLAEAGVKRVVYGAGDGDPRTADKAVQVLPALGIPCQAGVLERECSEFLDYYLYGHCLRRAFMHLKLAVSLDAKLACANGHSQWLSGPESLGYAHYLRQKYDAVLVGAGTVLADDPRLSVRPAVLGEYRALDVVGAPRNPVRVILDPGFTLLDRLDGLNLSRLEGVWRDNLPRVLVVGFAARQPNRAELSPGVELLGVSASPEGRIGFHELATLMYARGIRSVLVEGGARVAQEMLRQGCADKLTLVYTPRILGRDALGFSPALGCQDIGDSLPLARASTYRLGEDLVYEGYIGGGIETT